MAKAHLDLSQQIRSEMEDPTTALLNKQIEHRRAVQNPVEKKFKTKQAQESYVVKAREKYEGDRLRIASYSAQIEQNAPDLERIKSKLKRAEQTVGANEKDYANFCKVLADSLPSWENDWKDFCDSCQDMEEERFDFMKDNLWAYANAVSVVCVADDVVSAISYVDGWTNNKLLPSRVRPFEPCLISWKRTAISNISFRNTVQEMRYPIHPR